MAEQIARKRSRAAARAAGSAFEHRQCEYLQKHVSKFIYVKGKQGAVDKGDLGNVFVHEALVPADGNDLVVVECKNEAKVKLGTWAGETERERVNAGALAGVFFHKRHGVGSPGKQWVTMQVDDFVALLTGKRPEEN